MEDKSMTSKKRITPRKSTSAKKATAKSAAMKKNTISQAEKAARQVRVRMYNVGFGDAFLVLVPVGDRERRILFDCGSIEAAPGAPMASIVNRIVQDVTDADGVPRIDVVVATHRHKDHVSGFGQAAWENVEVKEVWMPWTEHPTDEEARKIRDVQARLALGLDTSLKAQAAALSAAEKPKLRRYQDIVANALMLSNEKAMRTLHSGFRGDPKRRFLPTKTDDRRTLETDALPGVRIHVLGPSRNPEVIRDMNPPKGESFLRLHALVDQPTGLPPAPFSPEFREVVYTGGGEPLTLDDEQAIQSAGSLSDLAVAVALDKAVNGTSLMLLLEIAGTFLLFPGDAQWGTWNAALEDPEWKELLRRVAFYKIGHHGSHNATPKEFVEEVMQDGVCCMASTLTRQIWPDIPRHELLAGLATKKAKIVRSDQPTGDSNTFLTTDGVIETRLAL
jgi:beta-lactamase superfamily II metal-dependent hydrolase